jgi:hypothetical protein
MKKNEIVMGLVSALLITILLAAGCGSGTSTKSSSISSVTNSDIRIDKFSLWANGTQLRGANIYQRIIYPVVFDDPEVWGNGPLGPVYTQEDFDALSAAGANFVVLSHPGLFDDKPPYVLNASVQDNLDRYIGMAEKADLFVVIAFRTGPGRSEFTFFGVGNDDTFGISHLNDEVWKDKTAQDKWVEMWRYAAARYCNQSVVVGYELMVEPNSSAVWLDTYEPADFYPAYENTAYDWNQMYPRITSAIREVDNDTPILIGAMSWSQVRWLPYLKPTGDSRTVYTIHQYEPQTQYTHQIANESGTFSNEYPGKFDTNWDGTSEDFNKVWIDNLLGTVDAFKIRYNVPVAATEYGAVRWEPGVDRFLDDEMARFEESGMNYAVWSWQPASKEYNEVHNEFNFRFGIDPANITEGASKMYDTLKKYWAKNTIKPSSFIRQ